MATNRISPISHRSNPTTLVHALMRLNSSHHLRYLLAKPRRFLRIFFLIMPFEVQCLAFHYSGTIMEDGTVFQVPSGLIR